MLNPPFDTILNFIFTKNSKYEVCMVYQKMAKSLLYFCSYLHTVERYYNYLIYIVMSGVALPCCDK